MRKKRTRPMLTAGSSSLLLIFLSLCLLTFAVLSFLSARADWNLNKKMADRTLNYYEACNEANDRLSEIDRILAGIYENTDGEEAYFDAVSEKFSESCTLTVPGKNPNTGDPSASEMYSDFCTLSFTVPLSERQVLSITLEIQSPVPGKPFYTVSRWKTVNTAGWTPDTRQNVYIQP